MSNDLTRPIIGIENRTAQEVFDIMCDRFRRSPSPSPAPGVVEALREIAESGEYTTGDGHARCVEIAKAAISAIPLTPNLLTWRDHGPNAFPARFWSAETPFGRYEIEEECASDSPRYRLEWHSRLIADEDSLPNAQSVAQDDFQRRILASLAQGGDGGVE